VTPWVRRLLFANVAVFFVQMTMPRLTDSFAFVPMLAWLRPWTIVTYMFLHGGLMHILFNMLGLFFFGPQVEDRLGPKRFATLYFLSGVTGAVVSFFLAPASPIIGASAGVFGVMLAFAYFWPNAPIYIWGVLPIPARVLVIITTIFALISGIQGSRGGVADFAHLGGYAGAYLYLKWLDRRTTRRREQFTTRAAPPPPAIKNWQQVDMKSIHEVNRDEVNRILDKISASGVDSLTAQEKTFLSNFVPPDDRVPPKT
jgi:membrane associated rhomboid family serine protease